jgi:hypothetical protein
MSNDSLFFDDIANTLGPHNISFLSASLYHHLCAASTLTSLSHIFSGQYNPLPSYFTAEALKNNYDQTLFNNLKFWGKDHYSYMTAVNYYRACASMDNLISLAPYQFFSNNPFFRTCTKIFPMVDTIGYFIGNNIVPVVPGVTYVKHSLIMVQKVTVQTFFTDTNISI